MSDQDLARDLGVLEAYTIGLGTMIGAGIFVLPSIVAEQAGPASMVSFTVGGMVSLLAALSLSELATGMPRAGGSYYYINRALGNFFGSIVGWGMWAGLMFASAFYMLGFGQYLTFFLDMGPTGVAIAALIGAAALTGINYYGVKETGALQNVIVLALVGLIIVFLTFGFLDQPSYDEFNPFGWGSVAVTVGTVYVTFIGFEVIATSAEEIKDPSRNLPLSMIAAVLTPTLLYVMVMYVSTGTLSIDALADSNIPVAAVAEQFTPTVRLPDLPLVGSVAFNLGALAMVLGAVLATVSSANASILSAARVNFAMGRDGILMQWLNEVHGRFRTPYRSIVATGIVIVALIVVGVGIDTLAEVASFMYLVTYSLVHVAVVVMRYADPEDYDPAFTLPVVAFPVVPILGFVASVVILVFAMKPTVQLIGAVIVLGGIIWYAGYARTRGTRESLLGEAIAPSETVAANGNDVYRIVVPVANPDTERQLLELAAASANAHDGPAELVAVNVIEVPPQTSLEQDVTFEEERVAAQQELLDAARDIADDLDIGIRTRAVVGRDVGDVVLDVVEDEDADQVLLGWRGSRSAREHVLGSNIDPIVGEAPCEATLIKLTPDGEVRNPVALAGEGPHAPVAARRANEFGAVGEDAMLTLLNVQEPDDDATETELEDRGMDVIRAVAEEAGIDEGDYVPSVVVAEDVEDAILEEVEEYDTVCVGATRSGPVAQALFGSIPERIGAEASGTVAMVRGSERSPMSIREAIVERLGG
ncbi:amino acid transporter [Halobacteriales archaeon QS_8_69_26]|nr:MAG: amino acid transporter [Halobacteriales archaeon QS_8_69_26]